MPYLDRNGASIFYDVVESAEGMPSENVVTLVNGHTRSSADFRLMARQLSAVGVRTIILDNRASGKSEVTQPFSLEDMEDDVVAVWDCLGIKKSSLLGISMGGFIVQGISAKYPSRVDKLVLVSTASGPEWIKSTGGGWINDGNMIEEKLSSYFAPGFISRNRLLFETMVRQTRVAILEGDFNDRSNLQKDALSQSVRTWSYQDIKAKTLIIHGDEDGVVDVGAATDLHEKIENSQLELIAGAGHLLLAEASKKLYELTVEWLTA